MAKGIILSPKGFLPLYIQNLKASLANKAKFYADKAVQLKKEG